VSKRHDLPSQKGDPTTTSGDTPYDPVGACSAAAVPWRLLAVARAEGGSDEGQTVTEYGVVLGVLMVLLAVTVLLLEPGIQAVVSAAANKVSGILP
jgi:Flp pilus assembly pilin Flp